MYTVAMVVYIDSPLCTGSRSSPIGCVCIQDRDLLRLKIPHLSPCVDESTFLFYTSYISCFSPSTSVSLSLWQYRLHIIIYFPFFSSSFYQVSGDLLHTHISKHIASGCIYIYVHTEERAPSFLCVYIIRAVLPPSRQYTPLPTTLHKSSYEFFLFFPSAVGLYNPPPLYTFPSCSTTRTLGNSS